MLDFTINKKYIAAFVAGCGFIFTIFSTLIMDPSDMWRWLINNSSKDAKVERALETPSETVLRLKDEVSQLSKKLIDQQADSMASLRTYIEENKRLKKSVHDLSISVTESRKEVDVKDKRIAQLRTELDGYQKKISQVEAEISKLRSSSSGNATMPSLSSEFILDNEIFIEGKPVLFYKGKLSVIAETCYSNKCYLKIVNFFPKRKEISFWLYKGSPVTIDVNGTNYIMHLLEGSTTSKSIISTFIIK